MSEPETGRVASQSGSQGCAPQPPTASSPVGADPSRGWHPISSAPYNTVLDLWCVYGGEDAASYWTGASVGKLVTRRHRSAEYGWFGNQSNDGVPQGPAPDLVPVAWRESVPDCPPGIIAAALNIPERPRDSDGSPKGGDAESGSVHDSAGPPGHRPATI